VRSKFRYYASVGNRSVEEHRRLSFMAFGSPQAKAGLSPAFARLGKLKLAEAYPTSERPAILWDKL
jgi:hypothetical protein